MVILASQSPRRQNLMKEVTDKFTVIVSNVDESKSLSLPPVDAVKDIAFRKALAVFLDHFNDTVISADTIVTIDNKIIGKPKDKEDAKKILTYLSGKTHHVYTAYVIMAKEKISKGLVDTEVTFEELSEDLIDRYIASNSPMDKAGAYGIQDDKDFHLVKYIKGSYTNVMGFPVDEIKKDFNELKN